MIDLQIAMRKNQKPFAEEGFFIFVSIAAKISYGQKNGAISAVFLLLSRVMESLHHQLNMQNLGRR